VKKERLAYKPLHIDSLTLPFHAHRLSSITSHAITLVISYLAVHRSSRGIAEFQRSAYVFTGVHNHTALIHQVWLSNSVGYLQLLDRVVLANTHFSTRRADNICGDTLSLTSNSYRDTTRAWSVSQLQRNTGSSLGLTLFAIQIWQRKDRG
jgi:hypothetical protein